MKTRAAMLAATLLGIGGGTLLATRAAPFDPTLILSVTASPDDSLSSSGIIAMTTDGSGSERSLSHGLYAGRRPSVSPTGTHAVFAGRRSPQEAWSLWEVPLRGGTPRPLTTDLESTDPLYLGADRILFSGRPDTETAWALYVIDRDASTLRRLTYHRGDDRGASLLREGWVVFSHRRDGESGPTRLFAMRPDGTGLTLVFEAPDSATIVGPVVERSDGTIVAILDRAGVRNLVSVNRNAPAAFNSLLRSEYLRAVGHGRDTPLVALAPTANAPARLYALTRGDTLLDLGVVRDTADIVGARSVESPGVVPGVLSVVDGSRATGWIYGIDANLSRDATPHHAGRAARLRITSVGSVWGEVDVEVDGSFFVELPADTPFRVETLDSAGRRIRGPSDWMWVRPGEHRGCIGCHEPGGMAPPNRVPIAVERPAIRLTPGSETP